MRSILGKMLAGCGFEICQAGNGREGLEVMDKEFPTVSLVLADWNMPEMNGLEFVQKLRSDDRFASVQVMMVTTETQIEQMTKALEAGANEYLMKPFTTEMIQEKLQLLGIEQ